jgi:hypothetical protein
MQYVTYKFSILQITVIQLILLSVTQCTVIVQMLNIRTVILQCIERRHQKNSKNKKKVTNNHFYFPLQQQFLQYSIKADRQFTHFLRTNSLLSVRFADYHCCSFCLSLTANQ